MKITHCKLKSEKLNSNIKQSYHKDAMIKKNEGKKSTFYRKRHVNCMQMKQVVLASETKSLVSDNTQLHTQDGHSQEINLND